MCLIQKYVYNNLNAVSLKFYIFCLVSRRCPVQVQDSEDEVSHILKVEDVEPIFNSDGVPRF